MSQQRSEEVMRRYLTEVVSLGKLDPGRLGIRAAEPRPDGPWTGEDKPRPYEPVRGDA